MELIIQASKWVVGGERLQSGQRLPLIRAYMDDMTTLTSTIACTKRLLVKQKNRRIVPTASSESEQLS